MLRQSPRRPWRTRILAALAAGVTVATAAACGLEQPSGAAATARDTTLSLAIQGAPNSFDPANLLEGQQAFLWSALYDTLLYTDNRGMIQPNAAESWSYANGGRTLTLKLRTGMTFSNGAPVDAAAVKNTLDYIRTTAGNQQNWLSAVQEVRTTDAHTVVLALSRADGELLDALSKGAGVIADPATLTQERTKLDPVGSGPYTLDMNQTVSGSTYVLNRRDDYWNAQAYPFRSVRARVIQDRTATVNALQAGELNAGSVEVNHVDRLKAAGFRESVVEASSIVRLVLADRRGEVFPALADLRVRKAINMAFDRPKIVERLIKGAGKPTQQTFNPKGPGYVPALEQTYDFDVDGAKRLMAEAGYPNGFAVTMPELIFIKPFTPTITQALAAIGITATWEPIPPQQNVTALLSKKYPMFLWIDGASAYPRELQRQYPGNIGNPFGATDPTLTALMEQYNTTADSAQGAETAKQISRFLTENAWEAPLFFIGQHWMTSNGIRFLGDGSETYASVRQFGVGG
ncbi:ABC transporter substrate-binding protein [Nocardia goodfellowii]